MGDHVVGGVCHIVGLDHLGHAALVRRVTSIEERRIDRTRRHEADANPERPQLFAQDVGRQRH
jgi:hypothetical protein